MFKELEKEKEKKIKHVVGGEGDENDVKIKEKWFGKQNKKEDEAKMNYEGGKNNDRKNDKRVWKLNFKTK